MKKILLVIAIAFCACGTKDAAAPNVEKVNQMFTAFNDRDWDAMTALYAEEASFLDPSLGKEYVIQTRGQTSRKYAELQSMFPDIHDEVVGMYPSGDKVVVEFIATGSTDSLKFRLPITSVLTLKDGLIVRDATYYDLESF